MFCECMCVSYIFLFEIFFIIFQFNFKIIIIYFNIYIVFLMTDLKSKKKNDDDMCENTIYEIFFLFVQIAKNKTQRKNVRAI